MVAGTKMFGKWQAKQPNGLLAATIAHKRAAGPCSCCLGAATGPRAVRRTPHRSARCRWRGDGGCRHGALAGCWADIRFDWGAIASANITTLWGGSRGHLLLVVLCGCGSGEFTSLGDRGDPFPTRPPWAFFRPEWGMVLVVVVSWMGCRRGLVGGHPQEIAPIRPLLCPPPASSGGRLKSSAGARRLPRTRGS